MHGAETTMVAQTCEQAVGVGLSSVPSLPAASEEVAAPAMEADARVTKNKESYRWVPC